MEKIQTYFLNLLSLMGMATFFIFLYQGFLLFLVFVGQIISAVKASGLSSPLSAFTTF